MIVTIAIVAVAAFVVFHFHLLASIKADVASVKAKVLAEVPKAEAEVKAVISAVETDVKKVL